MGSVHAYQTAAGRRYRVAYRKPDHSQGSKRGFRTKRDAELYLSTVEVSKARGEFIDAKSAQTTVAVLGADWLAGQSHLKPSSLHPIEIAWRLYVQPKWGKRAVGSIRHSEVQTWVTELTDADGKKRSATTVLRAYGVLAGILDVAVKDRRVSTNVARGVNLPRKGKKPRRYLTHEQVQQLADESGDKSTLVLFLAYTGLRWGEAAALRVRSVEALKRRVNVTENAVNVAGTIHVGSPKTHETRSVPYPKFLSKPLAQLCEGKDRDALLFGDGLDYIRRPDQRRGWFVAALKRCRAKDPGFPEVTIHDLRHTAASLAISSGANVKAVQRMLGHASAAMTLDTYADLFDDDLDAVADALDKAKASSSVVKVLSNRSSGK